MTEISAICSVPIDYIVMIGQGIKLLSFISKKWSEKDTLMPVIDKAENDGSFEGAVVFPPTCGLYIDLPVLLLIILLYPSCMISENISHDSKVWTKEYDLDDNLIKKNGDVDDDGNFIYDNIEGLKYVDVKYDTYEWRRESEKTKEVKVLTGYKICRFAQFKNNKKGIMPSVLVELLGSRKATRAKIKYKTLTLKNGDEIIGIPSEKEDSYSVQNVFMENGKLKKSFTEVSKMMLNQSKILISMKNVFNNSG